MGTFSWRKVTTKRNNLFTKNAVTFGVRVLKNSLSETKIPFVSGLSCKRNPGKNVLQWAVRSVCVAEVSILAQWGKSFASLYFWAQGHSGAVAPFRVEEGCVLGDGVLQPLGLILLPWAPEKRSNECVPFSKWTRWRLFTGIQTSGE